MNELKNAIESLLNEVADTREFYQSWKSKLPDGDSLDQRRAEWLSRSKFANAYDPKKESEWRAAEPGFASQSPVVAVNVRISNLKRELADAEAELKRLQVAGTPFTKYLGVVGRAESAVQELANRAKRQSLEAVLLRQYGTTNVAKMPRTVIDVAKLHPDVAAFELFRFGGRLSSMHASQIKSSTIDSAYDRVIEALERLLALVAQEVAA